MINATKGISSRLLFPFPAHFLSTIPIPVPIPMNSVYASHSRGTHGNSRVMHTSTIQPAMLSSSVASTVPCCSNRKCL